MSSTTLHFFFRMQVQIKLFHWHTHSYANHKATDALLEKLLPLIDAYVETWMGKYGREPLSPSDAKLKIRNLDDDAFKAYLEKCGTKLLALELEPDNDTDLISIRDDMLQILNQTRYLMTLDA